MAMKRINLRSGLWINTFDRYAQAVDCLVDKIIEEKSYLINFLYFANFVLQDQVQSYRIALINSDYIFPDGVGIAFYVKMTRHESRVLNLNGTDIVPDVMCKLNKMGLAFPIALYGSHSSVIHQALNIFKEKYSKLDFYHFQDGYHDFNFSKLKKNSTLLVGLGTPKQEYFVFAHRKFFRTHNITVITVGGLFDFISGQASRAPKRVRNLKLEWAHRMLLNPKRHIRKNLRNALIFKYIMRDYHKGKIYNCRGND